MEKRSFTNALVCLFSILTLFAATGCSAEKTPEPAAGFYEVDYAVKYYKYDIMFTPGLRLDPENNQFSFIFGSMMTITPIGEYTIEGTTITASTWQHGLVFTFEILDEHTLQLTDANVDLEDKRWGSFSDCAQIGDLFYWIGETLE